MAPAKIMFSRIALINSKRLSIRKHNLNASITNKHFSSNQGKGHFRVLGIETSCDDTGCAVVDSDGKLLGEALHNQMQFHLENGGIIPPIAGKMHRENMELVADQALDAAGLSMADIDVVAATVKPGMNLSLEVGAKYGCYLSKQWKKPFIPIHHMEAHALTARMFDKKVQFPFLALLISGGHCLLVVVQSADSYQLIGKSLDGAPGEILDKACRRLKLRNIPALRKMCGGEAVETMARQALDPLELKISPPIIRDPNCDFSFSGLKTGMELLISNEEKRHGTEADAVIPSASNLCASLQLAMARHLCQKLERAMVFLERKRMIPEDSKSLVVSGGVACNQFFCKAFRMVCDAYGYHLSVPPPKYCNDNGVMIAWNGVERFRDNKGILHWDDLDSVEIQARCPLGTDIRDQAQGENVKVERKRVKLGDLLQLFDVKKEI